MVDFTLRLPVEVVTRLAQCADEWNIPVQVLVMSALHTALTQPQPED